MGYKYREECESNIYHVTFRGVAKQIVFETDDDRRFFGKRMRQYLDELDLELYAWCFMSNHVHQVIRGNIRDIGQYMKKLLVSYTHCFNDRHDRVGHLSQSRFDSVPIKSDEQLMAVVRYVHRNPESIPGQSYKTYPWSSYREYLGRPFISDTEFVWSLFNGREDFIRFHEDWAPDDRPVFSRRNPPDDLVAAKFACELLGVASATSIASLPKSERDTQLATLKKTGLTVSQLARITGVGRNIIQRAK